MSSAEQLAAVYEKGEMEVGKGSGKRSKAEQAEHKHAHPEGDTRKIVNYCVSGEEKRKGQQQSTATKKE
uniref:Stress-induced protein, KGG, repeat-containing protein n=1 Tax=Syphacia muris TaxID=451379 RepID=A0A0N5AD31_9BILA